MAEDGWHTALDDPLNPNHHNSQPPGMEDDVENQGVVNRRNTHPPAEVEDQVD